MNLVQLTEKLRTECGASGQVLTTVQNVTGETRQLRDWIIDAWTEIQNGEEDWTFNRVEISKDITTGQQKRTLTQLLITDLRDWKRDEFRMYTNSVGQDDEQDLIYASYLDFRDEYLKGTGLQQVGRPWRISIDPADDSLYFGPNPNTSYKLLGTYYKTAQVLSADADAPTSIMAQFHMAIVYAAMMKYGAFNGAPEVFDRGKNGWNDFEFRLQNKYKPAVRFASGWGSD